MLKKFYLKNLNKIKGSPIQFQMNYIIGALTLLTIVVIASVTYIHSIDVLRENFKTIQMTILTETQEKINSRLKSLEKTMQMMTTDYRLQNYLDSGNTIDDKDVYKYFNDCIILNQYKVERDGIVYVNDLIDDIVFINSQKNFVTRRNSIDIANIAELKYQDVFKKAFQDKGNLEWTDVFYNGFSENYVKNSRMGDTKFILNQFMLVRYFVSEKYKTDIGYLAISMNLNGLNGLVENVQFYKGGEIYIADNQGRILACKNKNNVLKKIEFDSKSYNGIFNSNTGGYLEGVLWNKQCYISSTSLDINNWHLITVVPKEIFQEQADKIRISILLIGFISFVIIMFFGYRISKGITHPIKKIVKTMDQVEKSGDLNAGLNLTGPKEVTYLASSFNSMLTRIRKLTQGIYDEQKMKREAELRAMQLQINPHFLYNSLDSIKWMASAQEENQSKMVDIIESLSVFFRIGLSGGKEKILISDEMEHVRSYLTVQKIRYNDRLNFMIDVDKDICNLLTIKLILQPLVENAIYHGINNNKDGKGFIKIAGKMEDEKTVRLEVIDNGAGITAEKVQAMNQNLKSDFAVEDQPPGGNKGFGVLNVNSRLKLNFGNNYGLHFVSREGKGTKVEVILPVIRP